VGAGAIVLADGDVISSFRLERDGRRVTAAPQWHRDLGYPVRELLPLPGRSVLALTESKDETRAFLMDDDGSTRFFAGLPGTVTSAAAADGRLIAVTRQTGQGGATLWEMDLASGEGVATRRLPSPDVDIAASPSGAYIAIVDRRTRAVELRAVRVAWPCPPSGRDPQPTPPVGERAPCDGWPTHGDARQRSEEEERRRREEERKKREEERERERHAHEPCVPGAAAVPDDRGGAVVVDGGRVGRRPAQGTRSDDPLGKDCWADLAWVADRVRWAGRYIVATQGNFVHRLAIISSTDFSVVRDRDFGRAGALVFSGSDSDAVVVYHPHRHAFELVEPQDDLFVGALEIGPEMLRPPDEKTFVGQKTLSLSPEAIPHHGDIHVLVLPVVEPGQSYNEPNFVKIWNFLDGAYFGRAKHFYEENSFRQAHFHFHLFGHNRGPAAGPLLLPAPVASYFWPPFFAGGIELARTLPATPSTIAFDGSETLTLRVQPRVGARNALDLKLPFAAAHLRAEHDAPPVKIMIGAGQTGTIVARERDGTLRTLSLVFPPTTLQINQNDISGGLKVVEDYLAQVIGAAEAAAGVPGGPLFARPKARRVIKEKLWFGELHVSLSFAPRPPGPGRLAIQSVTATAGVTDT